MTTYANRLNVTFPTTVVPDFELGRSGFRWWPNARWVFWRGAGTTPGRYVRSRIQPVGSPSACLAVPEVA